MTYRAVGVIRRAGYAR